MKSGYSLFSLNIIIFYQKSTQIQNQIEPTEPELKIRNYSPKTIKIYLYGLKEYFAFKKKEDRFWPKIKFELIFFQVLWQFLETVINRRRLGGERW